MEKCSFRKIVTAFYEEKKKKNCSKNLDNSIQCIGNWVVSFNSMADIKHEKVKKKEQTRSNKASWI